MIACLSLILTFILLIDPVKDHGLACVIDFTMSAAWIAAFASMVNQISPVHCGELWYLDHITQGDTCNYWKVIVSFAFASGATWFFSAVMDVIWARRPALDPTVQG